ncbi:unnamed protein product [Protopolystoma xenopodis]|uniref:Uncharacterized protein n=1 Tax=Protopolystoma xenopodis TaxID=117903 RepID=A0A448XBE5_9PLAT|nr:unnamed protein product [Protopolystoma xenopodis]
MARLTDDAGESSGNVPRPRSYSGNADAYSGLRTRGGLLSPLRDGGFQPFFEWGTVRKGSLPSHILYKKVSPGITLHSRGVDLTSGNGARKVVGFGCQMTQEHFAQPRYLIRQTAELALPSLRFHYGQKPRDTGSEFDSRWLVGLTEPGQN